jgi:Flp pilus assembly protein TadG
MRPADVLRREDGQAITEFALILPVLVALLLGIIQFGIVFNNYLTITDAARAGARKAAVSRFIGDNGASAKTTAQNSAQQLDQTALKVTVTSTNWNVPGSDVNVTVTYPYSINILGWTVKAGNLTSTTKERLE